MLKFKKMLVVLSGVSLIAAYFSIIPVALATVSLSAGPVSPITSPLILPASSQRVVLFTFSLNANSGETLSSVSVEVDKANSTTQVIGNDVGSLQVYKDNGDGVFNPSSDALIGTNTGTIAINSPTTIPASYGLFGSGNYFVTLTTSSSWTANAPSDSITVTLPSNGIVTSANSPSINPVTTAIISASNNLAQTAISQQLSAVSAGINQGVYDSAALSNSNASASGTVIYNVYLGGQCSGPATFSDSEPVSFNQVTSSRSFSTTATGAYSWQSWYSGDAQNTSATSTCAMELVGPANLQSTVSGSSGSVLPSSGSLPVTGMNPTELLIILGSAAGLIIKKLAFNYY